MKPKMTTDIIDPAVLSTATTAATVQADLSCATTHNDDEGGGGGGGDDDGKSPRPFRVIIVGGGPGGLLMAHMLSRAGIEWTLLERRDDGGLVQPGTCLALWPQTARVLDQLGLLAEAETLYMPLAGKTNFAKDGSVVARSDMIERMGRNHGYPWMLFDRQVLLDFLLRRLPESSSRVQLGKTVASIKSTPSEARVVCTDGTEVHGSLIIGCDGVRSKVRRLMRDAATFPEGGGPVPRQDGRPTRKGQAEAEAGEEEEDDDDDAMSFVYTGLAGHSPRPKDMPPCEVHEMHHWNLEILSMAGPDDVYFFVFKRLDAKRPVRYGRRAGSDNNNNNNNNNNNKNKNKNNKNDDDDGKDNEEEEEEDEALAKLARDMADYPVVAGGAVRFGDLWARRTKATRLDFEEGLVKEWHRGRVALVSDAALKMTPNAAFSLTTGVQGMVELTNRLRRLLVATAAAAAEGRRPTAEELTTEVLAPYQAARLPMARFAGAFSGAYTRTATWSGRLWRLVDWLSPRLGGDAAMVDTLVAAIVKRSIVLDFAEEHDYREGKIPWKNGRATEAAEGERLRPTSKAN